MNAIELVQANSAQIKKIMLDNAVEITRLHSRIHETLCRRSEDARGRAEWENACAEFHKRYDELAFPGGYDGATQRILSGDSLAMEAAICFLECRPYFFRSGYMYKDLLRKVKRAPLTQGQALRFAAVVQSQVEWRARKTAKNGGC